MPAITRLTTALDPRGPWLIPTLLTLSTLYALSPFWEGPYPPMQDLPQHLAAGRVLLDGNHEGFAFGEYFTTEWLRSQYLGIYALLGLFFLPLSWFTEHALSWALRCAVVVLAVSWVVGAEALFLRLTKRRGLGLFALVLFFNVHLILGFLNFLLGISFALLGLALFSSLRTPRPQWEPRAWRVWAFGLVALACFYFHVVPFALMTSIVGATAALDLAFSRTRWWTPQRVSAHPGVYACLLPAFAAAMWWMMTPSGVSTREAAAGGGSRGKAQFLSFQANQDALGSWTVDAFRSEWDVRWLLVASIALTLYAVAEWSWALYAKFKGQSPSAEALAEPRDPVLVAWVRLATPACFVAYFTLPASYDWIWPINARFPLLALMLLPAWLPNALTRPTHRLVSFTFCALLCVVSVGQTAVAKAAFAGFSQEMEGLQEMLERIPKGQRVAALVFDRGSRHIGFSPFLHVGAYVQAERGGVSFFSFNDFPQSPVRFVEDNRPPRVPPRWEWKPERVRPDRDLDWFDYIVVRGGPRPLRNADSFEQVFEQGRFRLFERRSRVGNE